ncbi:CU044_5270 family protein [Nonomuraea sp. LP-02]|uniref:CU044_5270 family protein n=1 Tax=Nonomuraea sp. LP-02 TaxID=3097960 RepID=UPI002E2F3DF8|nr:CU044_5270 family protein [Nonomuraea sp. LP-02]MED7931226.1 CU044_5270 family protein [Nonomuraea sp. LP-02]
MNERTDLAELRDLFAGQPHPTAERLAPARTALLAEARTKRRPVRLRRVSPAGGLVAAMAAGVVAVQTFGSAAPASAAEVLRLAAEAATATPWPEPRDDQYLHYERIAETRSEKGVPNVGPRHITGEVWESADGSRPGLLWHKPSKSRPQSPEYQEILTRCPERGAGRPAYADLRKWPTDQEQLRHKLAEYRMTPGKDAATRTWNAVIDILGSPVPPEQQAAIFKIAATLPGIETEELKDATGRSGIAVTRVDNLGPGGAVSRESLIFDKTSYVLLGGQELVPGHGREVWSLTRPQLTDVLPAWSTSVKRKRCV